MVAQNVCMCACVFYSVKLSLCCIYYIQCLVGFTFLYFRVLYILLYIIYEQMYLWRNFHFHIMVLPRFSIKCKYIFIYFYFFFPSENGLSFKYCETFIYFSPNVALLKIFKSKEFIILFWRLYLCFVFKV